MHPYIYTTKYCSVKKADRYRIEAGNIEQLRHCEHNATPRTDINGHKIILNYFHSIVKQKYSKQRNISHKIDINPNSESDIHLIDINYKHIFPVVNNNNMY